MATNTSPNVDDVTSKRPGVGTAGKGAGKWRVPYDRKTRADVSFRPGQSHVAAMGSRLKCDRPRPIFFFGAARDANILHAPPTIDDERCQEQIRTCPKFERSMACFGECSLFTSRDTLNRRKYMCLAKPSNKDNKQKNATKYIQYNSIRKLNQ